MERIGIHDVKQALKKLHVALKAQAHKDNKQEQHALLRKVFYYVTSTLHKTSSITSSNERDSIVHRVLLELYALLVGQDGFAPPRIRILAAALMRELCSDGVLPRFFFDAYGGDFRTYEDSPRLEYFVHTALSELRATSLVLKNAENLAHWFNTSSNRHLRMAALSTLLHLAQNPDCRTTLEPSINLMEHAFCRFLAHASLETKQSSTTKLLGMPILSTAVMRPVTEIDGTPAAPGDFFTCMNRAVEYEEDQLLNVSVFSSLYNWLYFLYNDQENTDEQQRSAGACALGDDVQQTMTEYGLKLTKIGKESGNARKEMRKDTKDSPGETNPSKSERLTMAIHEGSYSGSSPETPGGKKMLDPKFREIVIAYCFRILSQAERDIVLDQVAGLLVGPKHSVSKLDWMREFCESVSMEAVRILDLLCRMDCSLVSRIFPAIKKVYERTCQKTGFFVGGLVFSAVLQYFLNHSHHVIFDVDPVLHHFFADYVSLRYRRPLLAMSTLLFLTNNTSKLLLHTNVFSRYYPAILKLLAWHPRTVQAEAILLLPAMVGPTSYISLFHSLLDLPLTAAFMEHYDNYDFSDTGTRPNDDRAAERRAVEKSNASFATIQAYVMRSQASPHSLTVWDTRDDIHLAMIQSLWSSLAVTPRVSSVCKLVPRFLRVYFEVLLDNAPPECIKGVVPLLLQRFTCLFPVSFYLDAVHAIIIDTLETIFQKWPEFLIALQKDIVNAISAWKLPRHGGLSGATRPGMSSHSPVGGHSAHQHGTRSESGHHHSTGNFSTSPGAHVHHLKQPAACSTSSTAPHNAHHPHAGSAAGAGSAHAVHAVHGVHASTRAVRTPWPEHERTVSPLVIHLCWIVGELLSPSAVSGENVNGRNIGEFFNALEALAIGICSRIVGRSIGNVGGGDMLQARPTEEHAEELARELQRGLEAKDDEDFMDPTRQKSHSHPEDAESGPGVHTPRVACVIISSLTKLGTKFPEYAPRVILCLSKTLRLTERSLQSGDTIGFVQDRLLDCLQLLRHTSIANSIYCLPMSEVRSGLRGDTNPSGLHDGVHPSGAFTDGIFTHVSTLSPLSHLSFMPNANACGKSAHNALHDFELSTVPPIEEYASSMVPPIEEHAPLRF